MTEDVIVDIITHHIPKIKEGTYYTVDFDVPENVEKITVEYSYFSKHKGMMSDLMPSNTVDIGLEDEKSRFLGWSGSAHKSISVGEFDSSSGYLCEKINPGKWKIIVGAYHIMDEGVTVTYKITFKKKAPRLLMGDLHIHSTASDGAMSAYELGMMAKEKGLDFIGLANHNNFSENYNLPHIDSLTFVPAVEWTHYKGHMNLFGVEDPFDNSFVANSEAEMKTLISNARKKGALVSVNHPKCPICPYLWEDDTVFDCMEIWNGPMAKRNTDAIQWWTQLLKSGRKINAVGGSDFHRKNRFVKLGSPLTAVYCDSPSASDILNAIEKGHCFVCENKESPKLSLTYKDSIMGDTAEYTPDIPLVIKADCKSVILVTDKYEKEVKLVNSQAEISAEGIKFAYIKAYKGSIRKKLSAVSNPIYFKQEVRSK